MVRILQSIHILLLLCSPALSSRTTRKKHNKRKAGARSKNSNTNSNEGNHGNAGLQSDVQQSPRAGTSTGPDMLRESPTMTASPYATPPSSPDPDQTYVVRCSLRIPTESIPRSQTHSADENTYPEGKVKSGIQATTKTLSPSAQKTLFQAFATMMSPPRGELRIAPTLHVSVEPEKLESDRDSINPSQPAGPPEFPDLRPHTTHPYIPSKAQMDYGLEENDAFEYLASLRCRWSDLTNNYPHLVNVMIGGIDSYEKVLKLAAKVQITSCNRLMVTQQRLEAVRKSMQECKINGTLLDERDARKLYLPQLLVVLECNDHDEGKDITINQYINVFIEVQHGIIQYIERLSEGEQQNLIKEMEELPLGYYSPINWSLAVFRLIIALQDPIGNFNATDGKRFTKEILPELKLYFDDLHQSLLDLDRDISMANYNNVFCQKRLLRLPFFQWDLQCRGLKTLDKEDAKETDKFCFVYTLSLADAVEKKKIDLKKITSATELLEKLKGTEFTIANHNKVLSSVMRTYFRSGIKLRKETSTDEEWLNKPPNVIDFANKYSELFSRFERLISSTAADLRQYCKDGIGKNTVILQVARSLLSDQKIYKTKSGLKLQLHPRTLQVLHLLDCIYAMCHDYKPDMHLFDSSMKIRKELEVKVEKMSTAAITPESFDDVYNLYNEIIEGHSAFYSWVFNDYRWLIGQLEARFDHFYVDRLRDYHTETLYQTNPVISDYLNIFNAFAWINKSNSDTIFGGESKTDSD